MQDSSIWPYLTGLLGSLAGFAALLGLLMNRKRIPADVRLITVQTEVAEATRGKTEAERDSIAFNVVSKALSDAERTIDRLRQERDTARDEVKILELQLTREARWRKLNGWAEPPPEK